MSTITVPRAVLEQALEALEQSETLVPYEGFGMLRREAERKHEAAIAALKAALEQPEQEPVAWRYQNANTDHVYLVWEKGTGGRNWTPLYTHPPRREWKGLTDQEIVNLARGVLEKPVNDGKPAAWQLADGIARAIEAALKEKNQ